jgi:alkanesulfonate monooxygenase SsuD/methylene tetrahydromethanopterin reductase-like flavin-dependent oxidoreductase (luciferase family)
MNVGLYLDFRNPPQWARPRSERYAVAVARVKEGERLELTSVWLTEHHGFDDGYLPQLLVAAAALGAATSRVRIGTAVMLAPVRPAIEIAEQAAVADLLSAGRLELGLGAGYMAHDFAAYGVDRRRRNQVLRDRVLELQRIWATGDITPPPAGRTIPLWLGVGGRRGAALAGETGSGMLALTPTLLDTYVAALERAGHDPAQARLAGPVNMIVADDPEAAWHRIAPQATYQLRSYRRGVSGPGELLDDVHAVRHPGPGMSPPRFDVVDPAECVRRLRAWLSDVPVAHAFLWESIAGMPDDLADRHLELLATAVAPAVRDVGVPTPDRSLDLCVHPSRLETS